MINEGSFQKLSNTMQNVQLQTEMLQTISLSKSVFFRIDFPTKQIVSLISKNWAMQETLHSIITAQLKTELCCDGMQVLIL